MLYNFPYVKLSIKQYYLRALPIVGLVAFKNNSIVQFWPKIK